MNKFEILSKLVAYDTTSRNSNLELINFINEYLTQHHIESRLTLSDCQAKANLFATIPTEKNQIKGGLILSGHTDVVPVDGQEWATDPFCATHIGNKIYGRGTCDMKGFIAVILTLIPQIKEFKLARPLHLAFSYDEETGCEGALRLIDDIVLQQINPLACIVGEPTSMQPVVAHKGINVFRCKIHGKASHSSLTSQGCNAIDYAAQLICKIREIADQLKISSEQIHDYDVPYSTMSTNLISGGNALNTIPAACEFNFELRNLPHLKPNVMLQPIREYIDKILLPKMKQEYPDAVIELDYLSAVPGLHENHNSNNELIKVAYEFSNCHKTTKVAYGTEAGLFQQQQINTIVCGPGNIQQAHRANEFIEVTELEICERFIIAGLSHLKLLSYYKC